MFIETKKINSKYTRTSKLGTTHTYSRTKTIAAFTCDNCNTIFYRNLGNIDHRRMNNGYYHVCSSCNPKKFAQTKSLERRQIWNLPVDSDIKI